MNEEEFIAKLKETAGRMQAEGIDPTQIQGFIDQKKNEWIDISSGKTPATAGETAGVVAQQPNGLASQLESGLSEPPEDDKGFFEDLFDTAKKGYASAGATDETITIMSSGYKSDEELQEYIEAKEEARSDKNMVKSQQEFAEKVEKFKQEGDNGFLAGFKAFADDPSMGIDVMVSSLAGQVRAAQEAPGIVAASTAAGAAAGTFVVPAFGTISGGLAGLRLSSMAVMEAQATFSELLDEKMQEQGLNLKSTADLRKVLGDEDAMDSIRRKAVGRGLAIGTIEAIFGKLAGAAGKTVNKASRLSKVGGAVKAVGIEAAGGMVGETAGMLVAGQELAGEEILLEGIAGTVFAPAQIAAEGLNAKADYRLNGEKLNNKKAINEVVENSSDEDFVNTKINVKNDKDLSNKIQERRKKIIRNNKEAVKDKIAPKKAEELKAKINKEIKIAEKQLKEVQEKDGDLAAAPFDIRIKRLKSQLEEVDNHINFQLDELSENETLALMDMDDDVALFQSIINDPNSSDAAKESAKVEIQKVKATQIYTLNNTDSADLARPDGPKKQKNIDLSEKTQKAYEKGGVNNYGEIAEHQMGTIKSIATSLWSRIPDDKKVGTYDDFVAAIISEPGGLRDMVGSYDPSLGVPLAAYLGNKKSGLRKRANRIVKKLTKQDIQQSTDSTEALNQFGEETDVDSISFGPRFNYQKLGLGKVLGNIESDVEIGLQKTINELQDLGEVTQKKRQSESEKAFNSIFKNKYDKVIKDFIGKNTKTSKDFTDFIDKNFDVLKSIALGNINFQKGSGVSNTWNTYAPSKQDFIDYYEGKDIAEGKPASIKGDRKKSLVDAIVADLSKSAREAYFETRPDEQTAFNEEQQIAFQEDVDEITGVNIFLEPGTEGDVEASITNINKLAKELGIENFDRRNPEFIKKVIKSLGRAADAGVLTVELLENLSMANFGAVNERRKDGNKYYKLKDGTFIIGIDTGKINKKGQKIFEAPKADLMPTGAGLFYSVKDPAFVDIKNRIKANDKSGTKSSAPIVNAEAAKKDSKTYNNNQEKQKLNNKAFSEFLDAMDKIAQIDPALMLVMVHDGYRGSSAIIKAVAPVKYISKTLEFGTPGSKYSKSYENNATRNFRDEHNPPASVIGSYIAKAAMRGQSKSIKPLIDKQFHRVILSLKTDEILDKSGFGGIMPKNFNLVFSNSLGRYFNEFTSKINGGIDPDSIIDIETGKSIREIYGIDNKGVAGSLELTEQFKDKTPDKLQSALQLQEASTPDSELTNNEAIEALSDMLGSIYGYNVVSGNKDKARKALKDIGYDDKTIDYALEQMGFNDPLSGTIYINSDKAGIDTAMHEFTHAWAEVVNKKDSSLFEAIYDKLKGHPLYETAVKRMAKGKTYSKLDPDSFAYKNEIMAFILGEEGKSLYEIFEGDTEAKTLIDKFFDYVKEALGFDPATKNFADLTINEVVKLSVKDMMEGNPASNFNKLQNVAEGKSWFQKSEANVGKSAKAKADPIVRAFNKLKLSYRKNKNLAEAINDAYEEVEGIMEFEDFVNLVVQNTKEINTGKTNQLLIAKAEVIKANKIAEESVKKLAEDKIKADRAEELQNEFRRLIYIAAAEGTKPSRWFIPPNAEDFKGLLYTFLPKGEKGLKARKWMEETLLKPYSDAIAALDTEILNKSKAWEKMSKGFDFNSKIEGTPYTIGDAIKVYNALQEGNDPGIAKQKHLDALIHAVESDSDILNLANEMADSFPIELSSGWQGRTLAKEVFDSINNGARKRHLETFSGNVDAIFNDTTLDLIADQYGNKFRQALVSTLRRMKTGRNRVSTDANANVYMNWLNRAVGTTMFLNTRSAALQLLSSLNFIGKPDNNLFAASAAFANQKQWREDYNKLWNSDYLTNRREGAKFDVLADELAEGDVKGLNKLLKFGFLPTRYADSYAIALGGAAFYRNRANSYMKQGMSKADAEAKALVDWRESAEESQQSSDPSKISEIQASSVGKIIYAFANTPFQYARIVKRKLQDITSGRSAADGSLRRDMQTIFYYAGAQAIMFNALQSGLVALLMSDDDDKENEELKSEKYAMAVERALTSFAKSTGNPGAVASTLYSMLQEGYKQQTGKKRPDANAFAITATSISPPLNSKLRDLAGAYRAFNKIDEDDVLTPSLDNEALTMAGEVASFGGVPLDRVIRKARHLAAIKNEEAELWQKLWMLAGWSEWELGVDKGDNATNFKEVKFKDTNFKEAEFKDSAFNKLKKGVAGQANRDGTIEIDPNLSPVEKAKTVAHEKQHVKDMDQGILDYDDSFVYWKNKKFKRKSGKILYNGKYHIEGDPKLPWEKRAYDAEPTTKQAKKLYA